MSNVYQAKLAWAKYSQVLHKAAIAKKLGISRASVCQWVKAPDHHIEALTNMTGIPKWALRPDLYARKPWEK